LAHEVFPIWLRDRDFIDRENPINDIVKEKNVNFTTYLVYDPLNNINNDPFSPSLRFSEENTDISGHKSAVVQGNSGMKNIIEGKQNAWGDASRLGYASKEFSLDQYDIKVTSVVISDSNIMAIGDADLLTNQHISSESNQKLATEIANWIFAPAEESKSEEATWEISILLALIIVILCLLFIIRKRRKYNTK
jgi:hypothetical protein